MSSAGHVVTAAAPTRPVAGPLDLVERRQLGRLRRWGTTGALLMMVGSTSSYGAANPFPNPVDGNRLIGLMSRTGSAALACSYTGIALVVLCWFLIGRLAHPTRERRISRSQLIHTLVMWSVPLLVTPPIFSRDNYSYLAVGSMMLKHFDPYLTGPYDALGAADPLAHQVDALWQHTPTPYGPVFLLVVKGVVAIAGTNVVLGVLLQRAVEMVGVALIIWALPRLARMCGVDPTSALWLGVLNPLLLFHLVAGAHNEALMIGFMMAGLAVGFGAGFRPESSGSHGELVRLVSGSALIAVAMGIKVTAGMALAFLVIGLARRAGGRWRDLFRTGVVSAVSAGVVFGTFTLAAGFGLGWLSALGTPNVVRSFLSVSTTIGRTAGGVGLLLGLGDHIDTTVDVVQHVGTALGAVLAVWVMWRSWRPNSRGRVLEPVYGLALALGAFVLLSSVIQPWYLLWAALPLAASASLSRFRPAAIWLTVVYALITMPSGQTVPVFATTESEIVGGVVALIVWLGLSLRGLPTKDAVDHSSIGMAWPPVTLAQVSTGITDPGTAPWDGGGDRQTRIPPAAPYSRKT